MSEPEQTRPQSAKAKDRSFFITIGITLFIMIFFGYLPPIGVMTPLGMKIFGVFIGCLFAWARGELVWSSLISFIVMAFHGAGTVVSNYAGAFGNQTSFLLIACLVFCYGLERTGVFREIALWIISVRFAQKSPWHLMLMFFIAAAVLGMLSTNVIATAIILWALFYDVAKEIGAKPKSAYVAVVLCGIMVVGGSGSMIMPYNAFAIMGQGVARTVDPEFTLNFPVYLLIGLFINIVFIPLVYIIIRYVVRPKVEVTISKREPYKMRFDHFQKWALFYLGALIILMIVPSLLPAGNIIRIIVNDKLGINGVFLGGTILMMFTRHNGKNLLDIADGLSHGVPWGLFMLVSSALSMSANMMADNTGILPTIIAALTPIFANMSVIMLITCFTLLGLLVTNFINDIVTITILLPIGYSFLTAIGGNPMILVALFVPATVQGCFMPSGSILGAMMHGNLEWMSPGLVYKFVAILEFILALAFIIVAPILVTTGVFG
ncbi:MAG: hypothetical protein LBK56_03740 [Gracilibacteraceae bacterium]|jgi:sodium-dependent dicarboxylate transporter 2/3/5|nr:hypothetical protein [Gracilibacteraceae bacterium]